MFELTQLERRRILERLDELETKSSEVDALMRIYGLAFSEACRHVCLRPEEYVMGCPLIDWLPSPAKIYEEAARLRDNNQRFQDVDGEHAGSQESLVPVVLAP